MRHKPGTRVLITEDCRPGGNATGQVGIYEGDFPRTVALNIDGKWHHSEPFYDAWIEYNNAPDGPHIPEQKIGEDAPDGDFWFPMDNPRIRLPDGSVIWGNQCWWGTADDAPPLNEAQKQLETHKAVMGAMMKAASELNADEIDKPK